MSLSRLFLIITGFTVCSTQSILKTRTIGSGDVGHQDGARKNATFSSPSGLVLLNLNGSECIMICDSGNHLIRVFDFESGLVFRVAGIPDRPGWRDGSAIQALLNHPDGLALVEGGDAVLIADGFNHRIRRLNLQTMMVDTIAGTGEPGGRDGPAAAAQLYFPSALVADPDGGRAWVAELYGGRVRQLDLAAAQVTTLSTGRAYPAGLAWVPGGGGGGAGLLAVADELGHSLSLLHPDTGAQALLVSAAAAFAFPAAPAAGPTFPAGLCHVNGSIFAASAGSAFADAAGALGVVSPAAIAAAAGNMTEGGDGGGGAAAALEVAGLLGGAGVACADGPGPTAEATAAAATARVFACSPGSQQVLELWLG